MHLEVKIIDFSKDASSHKILAALHKSNAHLQSRLQSSPFCITDFRENTAIDTQVNLRPTEYQMSHD